MVATGNLGEPQHPAKETAGGGPSGYLEKFTYSAPVVKKGVLDPGRISEEQALALMLKDPLLIRRPLMQASDVRVVGFDQHKVHL